MLAPSDRQPGLMKRLFGRFSQMPMPAAKPYQEMGVSGTPVFGGYVQSREKSSEWSTAQRYTTIADMAVNSSVIAAGVHYFLNLIAHPRWTVAPPPGFKDDDRAKAAAELVEDCLHDLTYPWPRVVRRAATYRFYGFGVQEWTAKHRPDGAVGLASIEPRPQATILRWSVSEAGTVDGVFQTSPQTGQELAIPRSKIMYLVDDTLSDSPEGVGIFRHLAQPWSRLRTFYDLEVRAYERDMRGIPIGLAPLTALRAAITSGAITQADADAMIAGLSDFIQTAIKKSNTALMMDSQPYESQASDGYKIAGVPQWDVKLLQGTGAGQAEIAAAIRRTNFEMAMVICTQHLMLGMEGASGNRALSQDSSRNLYLVANSVLGDIAAAVDRDIVGPICALNNIPDELRPHCEIEDVAFKDAESVAATLAKMAQAGALLTPDDPVVEDVRSLMGVSPPTQVTPELAGLPAEPPTDVELAAGGLDLSGGSGSGVAKDAPPIRKRRVERVRSSRTTSG